MASIASLTNDDPRYIRSRKALRDAFLVLLRTKPLEDITIRDIVTGADLSYPTFFRHHPTKESLLHDVAAHEISALVALSIPLLDKCDVRASCQALCTYVHQNRTLWSTFLQGGAANVLREEFVEQSRRVSRTRTQPRGPLPSDLGILLAANSILEVIKWWLQSKSPLPIAEIAEILDLYVVAPIVYRRDVPKLATRARVVRKIK